MIIKLCVRGGNNVCLSVCKVKYFTGDTLHKVSWNNRFKLGYRILFCLSWSL